MKMDRLDELIAAAHGAGILPASATRPANESKPWPLLLMVGLGAWLSAVPLFAFFAFSVGRDFFEGGGAYFLGVIAIGAAIALFRSRSASTFVEQLGLPVLLAGGALIWAGMLTHTRTATASLIFAGVIGVVALLVSRDWVRVLLGAFACTLITFNFFDVGYGQHDRLWTAAHTTLLAWVATSALRRQVLDGLSDGTWAVTVESASAGWLAVTLICLAASSGGTFLFNSFGLGTGSSADFGGANLMDYRYLVSAAAAAGGAAWLAKRWPSLRTIPASIVALVLVGLSWLNPTLGATLLVLSCCMASGRWRLAGAAGIAAAWIIGAFYYHLTMPLTSKALVMLGAGAALGGVAWFASPRHSAIITKAPRPVAERDLNFAAITLSAAAVLAVVNTGIWRNETLIAQNRIIFVELAPVDPRSIMQGDYMALAFRLEGTDQTSRCTVDPCKAVARLDNRGVAMISRLSAGEALAEGELLIELTERRGRWTMASDAWYFKEGEADRWSRARYGEFRVDSTGRALLVGMRGASFEAL
ncbi:MAG: hypothetical protein JWQ01_480 [Massilia sp.]|nr:hypothetical protein [Massilia sp.]